MYYSFASHYIIKTYKVETKAVSGSTARSDTVESNGPPNAGSTGVHWEYAA